jgi:hypothetical protein
MPGGIEPNDQMTYSPAGLDTTKVTTTSRGKKLKRRVKRVFRGPKPPPPDTRVAVWPTLKLLYVRVPKSGNTSIMHSIDGVEKRHMWRADIRAMDSSWTCFSFVRNPWARIVSAYLDKASADSRSPRMLNGVFEGFLAAGIPVYVGMPFAEFCEVVCAIPDADTEKHLRSQCSFLISEGEPIVPIIGKVETMAQDWRRIMQHAGQDIELLHLNCTRHHHYSEQFEGNARLINLVGDRYAEDVRYFNYDFDSAPRA